MTRIQVTDVPEEGIADNADVAPTGTVLVSVAVAPGAAERIVFTAEYGAIWLAREQAESPEEDPTLIITRANVYR